MKWLFDLLIDAIKAIANGIWDFFCDPIGSIIKAFEWVVDFLGDLLNGILDILKSLFMPDDGFFDKQYSSMKSDLDKKINISEYSNAFDSVKNAQSRSIPVQRSNLLFLGIDFSVFGSKLFEFLPAIRQYSDPMIRGVMFIILLLYNINNVYKLIRGNSLDDGGDE